MIDADVLLGLTNLEDLPLDRQAARLVGMAVLLVTAKGTMDGNMREGSACILEELAASYIKTSRSAGAKDPALETGDGRIAALLGFYLSAALEVIDGTNKPALATIQKALPYFRAVLQNTIETQATESGLRLAV